MGHSFEKKTLANQKFKMAAIICYDGRHFEPEILLSPYHLTHCTDFNDVLMMLGLCYAN